MAYAKASFIQDIRDMLRDEPWETTSTTTTTSATVAVPDGTKWAVGDVGEWSFTGTVGGEQFLVQSISGNNLTTFRGYNGTTAETHTSGDRVVKNPTYYTRDIVETISKVIDSLYPSAWKEVTSSVTPNTTTIWFDSGLTGADLTGMIDLIKGVQRYGTSDAYVGYFGAVSPHVPTKRILVERKLPSGLVTSTIGLRFPDGFFHTSNTVTVSWRGILTDTVSGSNYSDLTEGLQTEMIAHGVVARLLSNREITAVSEEQEVGRVGAGAFVGTASWYELKFRELLSQYRRKLEIEIPSLPDQNYLPGYF